ncbi:MAG: hypothetical protein PCFJNLEI_03126 [Verrucomicrobiae bacterium]|nr:hypothetical protein [Verrucomicrobiae bacterium]
MSDSQPSRDKTPQQILLFLGLVLVVGSIFVAWKTSLRREVNTKLAKIRAEGLPATAAELDQWYVLPPSETNAADLYANAFRAWKEPTEEQLRWLPVIGSTNFPPVGVPLPEEMQQAVEVFLSDNSDTLRRLHEAAQVKHCRYPVDLSNGMATLLPHLTYLRKSARLLALQADYAARNGNPSATVAAIQNGLAVGESLRSEPLHISQLVRIACLGITTLALERALWATPLQEAELKILELAVLEADKPQALFFLIGRRTKFWKLRF